MTAEAPPDERDLSPAELRALLRETRMRLEEAEETVAAIRRGDFDAVVVENFAGERFIYTLENADRPYRVLIEQIQEGAFTLSADGTVLYCNRRLAEMLGLPQERVVGLSLRSFVLAGDVPAFARLLDGASEGVVRGELALALPNGISLPVNLSLSQLHREEVTPLLCGVLTDLSEQRLHLRDLADANDRLRTEGAERERIEETLRQSQKMEAVGQLTGGVAHDFNNLLTVIKSSTDLLKRPDLPEDRRTRYIGAISDTVDRAARLTGQLLAFARRQALKPEVFDVGLSVAAIGDMVATLTGSRIEVAVLMPDAPCFVDADPSQFDTALVNMAVNARDAMEGAGRLTIRVEPVLGIPMARAHPPVAGAFVAVAITDTGTGIPVALIGQIFEPFFTTKGIGQGTGLGLSQVFGFAKQSGGEIRVESEVGRGTTFTLYLPEVSGDARVDTPAGEPEPLADGHGTCILVVEDNHEVGTFATQTLAELGYGTVWAADAEEALAELDRNAVRFDVVFSDVVMPGMNGIDLAREIRRRHADLPVVLTSGYSHVLAQNGTCGFALLHKPYSVEDLSRILSKVAMQRRETKTPSG